MLWFADKLYNPSILRNNAFPPNDSQIETEFFDKQYYKYTNCQMADLEIPVDKETLEIDEVARATFSSKSRASRLRKTTFTGMNISMLLKINHSLKCPALFAEGGPLKPGDRLGQYEVVYRDDSEVIVSKRSFLNSVETRFSIFKYAHVR